MKSLFALSELPGLDCIFCRDQWTQDTNNWISINEIMIQWRYSQDASSVLWLKAGAATGKSILASTVVNDMVQDRCPCQYFFIRHGYHKMRSLSFLLRALTFQIAQSVPGLARQLNDLKAEDIDLETAGSKVINPSFSNVFGKMHSTGSSTAWIK